MHRVRTAVHENALSDPARVRPRDYEPVLERDGRGWVAEADGAIVGFAVGDLARSNVWALFVDPVFERRGIGRALHEIMLDWLFDAGAPAVWLSTEPGTRAARFYESAGWCPDGEEANGEARYRMARPDWLGRRQSTTPGG